MYLLMPGNIMKGRPQLLNTATAPAPWSLLSHTGAATDPGADLPAGQSKQHLILIRIFMSIQSKHCRFFFKDYYQY